jgi:outer membrane protein assembly factor BamE (lipoprotein component of BamABCDE complex)
VRLAALFQGLSTQADVRALFGRPAIQTRVRGYEVWYYEIRVYNPFEEFPDDLGR